MEKENRKLKREKQQRKIAKAHARKLKLDPDAHQINILCLKHGAKYLSFALDARNSYLSLKRVVLLYFSLFVYSVKLSKNIALYLGDR